MRRKPVKKAHGAGVGVEVERSDRSAMPLIRICRQPGWGTRSSQRIRGVMITITMSRKFRKIRTGGRKRKPHLELDRGVCRSLSRRPRKRKRKRRRRMRARLPMKRMMRKRGTVPAMMIVMTRKMRTRMKKSSTRNFSSPALYNPLRPKSRPYPPLGPRRRLWWKRRVSWMARKRMFGFWTPRPRSGRRRGNANGQSRTRAFRSNAFLVTEY